MQHIILVGEDGDLIGSAVGSVIPDDVHLIHYSGIDAALPAIRAERPLLVVVTLGSGDVDDAFGADAFGAIVAIRRMDPDLPIVVVAPCDDAARARAMKLGASEIISTPIERDELAVRLAALLRTRRARRESSNAVRERTYRLEHRMIFDGSPRMENVRRVIESVAHLDCTVLVRGESGTGKELVARALAAPSIAQGKPFVKVNCAALPAELLEAELFGYERGAFTGAFQRKLGKFEFAHQGTVFLDEIGEMSAPMQAKVLQVLQDGEFSRLGGTHDTRVDVRIIAATHRDLERDISEGRFREDLFFRLNVISVTLPPLRERPDSIPLIADYFLRKYSDAYKRPYVPLSEAMLRRFMEYSWPGNIRELENLVQRMVILGAEASAREIAQAMNAPIVRRQTSSALAPGLAPAVPPPSPDAAHSPPGERMASLKDAARIAAQQVERDLIVESLRKMRWNRKETAKLLGVSYKTLLAKIRENGLDDEVPDSPLQNVG